MQPIKNLVPLSMAHSAIQTHSHGFKQTKTNTLPVLASIILSPSFKLQRISILVANPFNIDVLDDTGWTNHIRPTFPAPIKFKLPFNVSK